MDYTSQQISGRTSLVARAAACALLLFALGSLYALQKSGQSSSRQSEDSLNALSTHLKVKPNLTVGSEASLKPLELGGWGDAACWKDTGGTCRVADCDSWRQATCSWEAGFRCWCSTGCVDATGKCQDELATKVAHRFRLRNVAFNDTFLAFPANPVLSLRHVVGETNPEPGLDQFALWKQPGLTSDSNATAYFLTSADNPQLAIGLPGLEASKVFACMKMLDPSYDPAQAQVQPCRPAASEHEYPGAIEFGFQDTVMRLGHLLQCAEAWAHAGAIGSYAWWYAEPQLPFYDELPKCGGSWATGAYKYTVEAGKKAYDALMANAGLIKCLENMPKKWTLDGLIDDAVKFGEDPINAPTGLYYEYIQPMVSDLGKLGNIASGGPINGRSMCNSQAASGFSFCLLGHEIDLEQDDWPTKLVDPVMDALKVLENGNDWGPLACLMKFIIDPALEGIVKIMATSIQELLRPIGMLGHWVKQHLPYHQQCFDTKAPPAGGQQGGRPGGKPGGRRLPAANMTIELLGGRRLQAGDMLQNFFGTATGLGPFFGSFETFMTNVMPGAISKEINSACMKQIQTAKPGANGRPDLSALEPVGLLALALPAILTVVLKGHILPDFKSQITMPSIADLKNQLTFLFHSGGQAVTSVAGILPEVGGLTSAPIMAVLGTGFTLLMAKFGAEVIEAIGCVLNNLAGDVIKKVSAALKPGIDFIENAEHELMAYLGEEFAFMVPIVQHIMQVVIPAVVRYAGPGVQDCMNLLWKSTGQNGPIPPPAVWNIPAPKPAAMPKPPGGDQSEPGEGGNGGGGDDQKEENKPQ